MSEETREAIDLIADLIIEDSLQEMEVSEDEEQ